MTAPLKAFSNGVRAVDIATLVKPDQADTLCIICHVKPRAAGGKLSRCLDCLRTDVEIERQQRETRRAKAREEAMGKAPPRTKACRTCKTTKPLASFDKHRLAKDLRRHDCKVCVRAERMRRKERTEQ